MTAFAPLMGLLEDVPDPRRAEGKLYKLPYVLLFSILAIVTGCNSYRGIVTFIDVHRNRLNASFGLNWRRAPAHTAIRYILQGLDPAAVEAIFRNSGQICLAGSRLFVASGIYGQNIYVLPADDLVIAKFSTWPTPLSPAFEDLTTAAVDAVAEALR